MKLHRLGATEGRIAPKVPVLSPDRPDGLAIWVGCAFGQMVCGFGEIKRAVRAEVAIPRSG